MAYNGEEDWDSYCPKRPYDDSRPLKSKMKATILQRPGDLPKGTNLVSSLTPVTPQTDKLVNSIVDSSSADTQPFISGCLKTPPIDEGGHRGGVVVDELDSETSGGGGGGGAEASIDGRLTKEFFVAMYYTVTENKKGEETLNQSLEETLEERDAKYRETRRRIFGRDCSPDVDDNDEAAGCSYDDLVSQSMPSIPRVPHSEPYPQPTNSHNSRRATSSYDQSQFRHHPHEPSFLGVHSSNQAKRDLLEIRREINHRPPHPDVSIQQRDALPTSGWDSKFKGFIRDVYATNPQHVRPAADIVKRPNSNTLEVLNQQPANLPFQFQIDSRPSTSSYIQNHGGGDYPLDSDLNKASLAERDETQPEHYFTPSKIDVDHVDHYQRPFEFQQVEAEPSALTINQMKTDEFENEFPPLG
eukprot:GHVH01016852.1.p1 GENE.GHVH01016852.1~~GHVH01016852.1.p1  ORF type:complete len:414 (-),score=50.02 GHVH01016852.1:1520-2761(-)